MFQKFHVIMNTFTSFDIGKNFQKITTFLPYIYVQEFCKHNSGILAQFKNAKQLI